MTTPLVRYPTGPITPAGAYYLITDRLPYVYYQSPDQTVLFNLLGGPAIPQRTAPECVTITDLKGLIPPWQNIEQKGATQDGSSYITSLYDPLDADLTVRIHGRNPIYTRQVVRDWVAAWDAKTPGTLGFWSQEMGTWWAAIQWAKQPADMFTGGLGNTNKQKFVWPARAYNAFWRSDANVAYLQVPPGSGSTFLPRVNIGDQPMFDTYTCYGPGEFIFADGPGSTSYVTFGPLLPNQIVQVRTDPRKRGVVDLTSTPPSPQEKVTWQTAINEFISFATAGNLPQALRSIESLFGVTPPQGNLYSLLNGRFSDNAAIPPKPAGGPAPTYHTAVAIQNGNANSAIVASGIPLRRLPY